jgi:uncharacterized protein YbjQ (UPF0145 family)
MDARMTTTTFDLEGYRVARHLGVVRGITVRSRGLAGQLAATLRTIGGGKIHEYVELCEQARDEAPSRPPFREVRRDGASEEAFDLMVQHAEKLGANAIIGVRYDATELAENMTEVLAYGTAVVVERV